MRISKRTELLSGYIGWNFVIPRIWAAAKLFLIQTSFRCHACWRKFHLRFIMRLIYSAPLKFLLKAVEPFWRIPTRRAGCASSHSRNTGRCIQLSGIRWIHTYAAFTVDVEFYREVYTVFSTKTTPEILLTLSFILNVLNLLAFPFSLENDCGKVEKFLFHISGDLNQPWIRAL